MRPWAWAGLTLVELVLAAVLAVVAAGTVISGYNFLFVHTKTGISRENLSLQIDYALEKIRLQCESASAIDNDYLLSSLGEIKDRLCITAERDPYTINITDPDSKKRYCYKLDNGNLILERSSASGTREETEILLNSSYHPSIQFEYSAGSDPFSLTVAITATAKKIGARARDSDTAITRKDNIRFRYTKIVE